MRFPRIAILGSIVVVAAMLVPGSAAQAVTSCRAKNASLGTAARSDLQAVINAAKANNRIVISGVCSGNYTVGKSLTLEGQSTSSVPTPTLDGRKTAQVLSISAGTVRIKKLTIQNGSAQNGGGIYNGGGSIVLNATTVQSNTVWVTTQPTAVASTRATEV